MSADAPTVLLVDDESSILDSLRILLKNAGFAPHVANGGRAGLAALESLAPDIVLSDIRMPGVSSPPRASATPTSPSSS